MLVADETNPEKSYLKLWGGGVNRKKEWTDVESSSEIIEPKLIFVKCKRYAKPPENEDFFTTTALSQKYKK